MVNSQCLSRTLDGLDKFGMTKSPKTFRRQAEAAARATIKRVDQGKEVFCPRTNPLGRMQIAWQYVTGSWKSSERGTVVHTIAENALAGKFEFSWPAEYECVNGYRSTRIRIAEQHCGRIVGKIANMTLYCE